TAGRRPPLSGRGPWRGASQNSSSPPPGAAASASRFARAVTAARRSAADMPRSLMESNVIISWRGRAGTLGSVILLLLGDDRVARRASPESAPAQQVMKIAEGR